MNSKQWRAALCALVLFCGTSVPSFARGPASGGGSATIMHLGAGFLMGGGRVAPGLGVDISTRIGDSAPVYLGINLGAYFYTSPFVVVIPILPEVYYRFPSSGKLTPVLGLMLGPVVALGSSSSVDFGFFFKPGLEIAMSSGTQFYFQARLGGIGSTFYFWPHFGLRFPF